MTDRLLRSLADQYGLADAVVARLRTFADLLATDPLAPTTVTAPAAVMADHIADALAGLGVPELVAASTIADLGAGAGVPGLPLAIALPGAQAWLVESNHRKCEFIDRAITATGTPNARSVWARAEEWGDGIGVCDVVLARAVAPLSVLAEYAAPLLRIDGVLVAWRGKREPQVEAEAALAAEILGMSVEIPRRVHPYPEVEARYLHIMRKVSPTPARFPRRPGMARKRPLGTGR